MPLQFIRIVDDCPAVFTCNLYSGKTAAEKLHALASAIARSPAWADVSPAVLVVRSTKPLIAVLGEFSDEQIASLQGLKRQIDERLQLLRLVTYEQAERDAGILAGKLERRFGAEVRNYGFVAIPRGGFFVIGMLAYWLGLGESELTSPYSNDHPLVLVDDCSLTGNRFARFIENAGDRPLVFATLYANPILREAIKAAHRNVMDCISAHDIQDHAPAHLGDKYQAWRDSLEQNLNEPRYWVGQTECVVFPWNEPDYNFWNPVSRQFESGWNIVPPSYCLKNRANGTLQDADIQIQPEGNGKFKPSEDVIFGQINNTVHILEEKSGRLFGLDGAGATIWNLLLETDDIAAIRDVLIERFNVDSCTAGSDIEELVGQLMHAEILTQSQS